MDCICDSFLTVAERLDLAARGCRLLRCRECAEQRNQGATDLPAKQHRCLRCIVEALHRRPVGFELMAFTPYTGVVRLRATAGREA
jgi:hypothetical protein